MSKYSLRYLRCTTCGCQVGVRLLLLTLSGPHAAQNPHLQPTNLVPRRSFNHGWPLRPSADTSKRKAAWSCRAAKSWHPPASPANRGKIRRRPEDSWWPWCDRRAIAPGACFWFLPLLSVRTRLQVAWLGRRGQREAQPVHTESRLLGACFLPRGWGDLTKSCQRRVFWWLGPVKGTRVAWNGAVGCASPRVGGRVSETRSRVAFQGDKSMIRWTALLRSVINPVLGTLPTRELCLLRAPLFLALVIEDLLPPTKPSLCGLRSFS